MASAGGIRAGRAFVELGTDDKGFATGLARASARLKAFGESINRIGRSFIHFGMRITGAIADITKVFAEFDDYMRELGAVIPKATTEQLARLTVEAKRLGATTSFTAREVAALMVELGRAGFNATEVEGMTASVLNLARATRTDTPRAAEIASSALRQFGLQAVEMTRVVDVLTAVTNNSATTLDDMGYTLKYAAKPASALGYSIEELNALIGALANMGIRGITAGTTLRRLMTITAAESEEFAEIFGVSMRDAAGQPRKLVEVFEELDDAMEGLDPLERAEKFYDFFGLLGITGAESLTGATSSIRELQKVMDRAGGTSARVAREMDAGLGGATRIMKSAFEALVIEIGESLAPALINIFQWITDNLTTFGEFVQQNRALVVAVAAAGPAFIALGGVLMLVGTSVTALAALLGLLGAAVGFLLTPMGAIVGISALIAVNLGWLAGASRELGSAFQRLGVTFSDAWSGIRDAIEAGDLGLAMEIAAKTVQVVWLEMINVLKSSWSSFTGWLTELWRGALFAIGSAMATLAKAAIGLMDYVTPDFLLGKPKESLEMIDAALLELAQDVLAPGEEARAAAVERRAEIDRLRTEVKNLRDRAKAFKEAKEALARAETLFGQTPSLPAALGPRGLPWQWWSADTSQELTRGRLSSAAAEPSSALAQRLADAVSGTFSGRVAGLLGGTTPIQKKTEKLMEDQLDELQRIRRHIEQDEGERFS